MDSLSSLPPKNDTVKTPEEEAIMNQLFPEAPSQNQNPSSGNNTSQNPAEKVPPSNIDPNIRNKPPAKVNWKLLGIATGLFIFLANPYIDNMLCKIPYCNGGMTLMGLKSIIFSVLLLIAYLVVQ